MVRLCRQFPISSPRATIEFEYRDVRRRATTITSAYSKRFSAVNLGGPKADA